MSAGNWTKLQKQTKINELAVKLQDQQHSPEFINRVATCIVNKVANKFNYIDFNPSNPSNDDKHTEITKYLQEINKECVSIRKTRNEKSDWVKIVIALAIIISVPVVAVFVFERFSKRKPKVQTWLS